ncbi:hypothetical protein B0H16DRAFT_1476407 [Mycena metata]|uniref:Uncharacterized protein n=1 Tax=Mycena metata TaxID=1033252 RepID=A0AAD7MGU2_9AGAR|nr:hypothetical protein B0H16DRAFT_1476407 [Mycena metata]
MHPPPFSCSPRPLGAFAASPAGTNGCGNASGTLSESSNTIGNRPTRPRLGPQLRVRQHGAGPERWSEMAHENLHHRSPTWPRPVSRRHPLPEALVDQFSTAHANRPACLSFAVLTVSPSSSTTTSGTAYGFMRYAFVFLCVSAGGGRCAATQSPHPLSMHTGTGAWNISYTAGNHLSRAASNFLNERTTVRREGNETVSPETSAFTQTTDYGRPLSFSSLAPPNPTANANPPLDNSMSALTRGFVVHEKKAVGGFEPPTSPSPRTKAREGASCILTGTCSSCSYAGQLAREVGCKVTFLFVNADSGMILSLAEQLSYVEFSIWVQHGGGWVEWTKVRTNAIGMRDALACLRQYQCKDKETTKILATSSHVQVRVCEPPGPRCEVPIIERWGPRDSLRFAPAGKVSKTATKTDYSQRKRVIFDFNCIQSVSDYVEYMNMD